MAHEAHEAQETTLAPWPKLVPGRKLVPSHKPMTADDLLALPDDGWQYELVEGRLVRMAPPGGTHGEVAGNLFAALYNWVTPRKLGRVLAAETGFALGPRTVRAVDAAYVRAERVPAREDAARER
jgi:Uma2 family endonuclease